jgi:hypothetical protein
MFGEANLSTKRRGMFYASSGGMTERQFTDKLMHAQHCQHCGSLLATCACPLPKGWLEPAAKGEVDQCLEQREAPKRLA